MIHISLPDAARIARAMEQKAQRELAERQLLARVQALLAVLNGKERT